MKTTTDEGAASGIKLLQVEPTTRCNFTCGFCCGRQMDQNDVSMDDFQLALDKFPHLERLELHGEGEPMMHPGIFDMAQRARERGLTVSTITNGSLFTRTNIHRILESGIETLFVSIESPDVQEFKNIRGGSLEKVKRGIRKFLAERDLRGLSLPTVGFSVTVLKRTQAALPDIAALYRELGMDGGISAHMLNTMPSYVKTYTNGMADELLTKTEQALAWTRYARIIGSPEYQRTKVHFSDEVFGQVAKAKDSGRPKKRVKEYRSCTWLDSGLYINRHGATSGCARIKDTTQYGFGSIRQLSGDAIAEARDALRRELHSADIPEACSGCFIAETISVRLTGLMTKKSNLANEDGIYAEPGFGWDPDVIGELPVDVETIDCIAELCDGSRTSAEIANTLGKRWGIAPHRARSHVLPVISELVRENIVTI